MELAERLSDPVSSENPNAVPVHPAASPMMVMFGHDIGVLPTGERLQSLFDYRSVGLVEQTTVPVVRVDGRLRPDELHDVVQPTLCRCRWATAQP